MNKPKAFAKVSEVIPGGWHGTLTDNTLRWWRRECPSGFKATLSSALLLFVVTLAIVGVVYFLALGLGSGTAIFLEASAPEFAPFVFVPPLLVALVPVTLYFWSAGKYRVMELLIDKEAGRLEYVEMNLYGVKRRESIPIDAVVEMVPVAMTSYAEDGHFEVTILSRCGETKILRVGLGFGIPLPDLSRHSEWLSPILGNRMKSLMRHDC